MQLTVTTIVLEMGAKMTILIKITPNEMSDKDISYINKKMDSMTDRKSFFLTEEEYDNNIAWFVDHSKHLKVGCVDRKIEDGKEYLKTIFEVSEMFSERYDIMIRYLAKNSKGGLLTNE